MASAWDPGFPKVRQCTVSLTLSSAVVRVEGAVGLSEFSRLEMRPKTALPPCLPHSSHFCGISALLPVQIPPRCGAAVRGMGSEAPDRLTHADSRSDLTTLRRYAAGSNTLNAGLSPSPSTATQRVPAESRAKPTPARRQVQGAQ